MAASRNIQESYSNGHSTSGENFRGDTSDLDISETEALFTQIADYFDPNKPSRSSSDKKECRQVWKKVTSDSAAGTSTSNNVFQTLPSCSDVLSSGHREQDACNRTESSLSKTEEHFLPKPRRFESRGFGASEDWQSGPESPCDTESLCTHPESLRTHEPLLQSSRFLFHPHSASCQTNRQVDPFGNMSPGFVEFTRQHSSPSVSAASGNLSRSPTRKRNRWSCDDSVSFRGPAEETGHMNDEEYAMWLQEQIDMEDYWHNRLQVSNFQDVSSHSRTGNYERTFSNRRRRRSHGRSSPWPENNYEAFWELQERNGDVKSRGISQDEIDQLPVYVLSTKDLMLRQDRSDCRVCMEKYKAGETERVLTCFHSFHVDCIDKWLLENATCPVCRESALPEEKDQYGLTA